MQDNQEPVDPESEFNAALPLIYDQFITHNVRCTALTALPIQTRSASSDEPLYTLLYPTTAGDDEELYTLDQVAVKPLSSARPLIHHHDTVGVTCTTNTITALPSECNRLRADPTGPRYGMRLSSGAVHVRSTTPLPEVVLTGAEGDAFPLAWAADGRVATSSTEGRVVFWALDGSAEAMTVTTPWTDRDINDIDWVDDNTMAVSTDGGSFAMVDIRGGYTQVDAAHDGDVLCGRVTGDGFIVTCSGGDWTLRDLRLPETVLYYMPDAHKDEIYSMEMAPGSRTVFATGGKDACVRIWDLDGIGREQPVGEKDDGPPELLFDHRGHQERINDIQWTDEPWTLVTAGDEGLIQVWRPNKASIAGMEVWDIGAEDVM